MSILFFFVSLGGCCYFFLKKRKVDLYTVSFFSALIYFMPGFFGYVVYPGRIRKPIHDQVYTVFCLVLLFIVFGALIKDFFRRTQDRIPYVILGSEYFEAILSGTAFCLMGYQIVVLGPLLLAPKRVMMSHLGPSFVLLRNSASLAFLVSYLSGKKTPLRISLGVLLFTFLIGFRSPVALTGLALIVLQFGNLRRAPLVSYAKYAIPISFFGYIVAMGKVFYGTFKAVGLRGAFSVLFNAELIVSAFSTLEPFGVQAILNEIIVSNFHIGFSHLKNVLYQLLVIPSRFGGNTQAFNIAFQTQLFPEVTYGMAYNIWGEALASGGYPFLLLVIVCFLLGISFFDRLLESGNHIVKGTAACMGTYWSFYIHRNSISTELTLQRHILYTFIIGMSLSLLLTALRKLGRKGHLP